MTLMTDPELIIVQCNEAVVLPEDEEDVPGAGGVEPEVIGRKPEDEEGEE